MEVAYQEQIIISNVLQGKNKDKIKVEEISNKIKSSSSQANQKIQKIMQSLQQKIFQILSVSSIFYFLLWKLNINNFSKWDLLLLINN
jgi:hypothetical protein